MGKHIQPPVFPVVMQAGDILQEPRQDNRCVSESLTDRESWLWSVSKNEAVSFPAPLSVHSLPVHGQRPSKPALSLFLSTSRVRVYDAGGRTDVFLPMWWVVSIRPRPGQDIAVPAEVLNGLKIMVAIRWYHPQHVPSVSSSTTDDGWSVTANSVPLSGFHVRPERPPCIPGMSFSVASCHCVSSGYRFRKIQCGRTGHHQKSASQQCRFLFK